MATESPLESAPADGALETASSSSSSKEEPKQEGPKKGPKEEEEDLQHKPLNPETHSLLTGRPKPKPIRVCTKLLENLPPSFLRPLATEAAVESVVDALLFGVDDHIQYYYFVILKLNSVYIIGSDLYVPATGDVQDDDDERLIK